MSETENNNNKKIHPTVGEKSRVGINEKKKL